MELEINRFRVQGLGLGGLGFRVSGSGLGALGGSISSSGSVSYCLHTGVRFSSVPLEP